MACTLPRPPAAWETAGAESVPSPRAPDDPPSRGRPASRWAPSPGAAATTPNGGTARHPVRVTGRYALDAATPATGRATARTRADSCSDPSRRSGTPSLETSACSADTVNTAGRPGRNSPERQPLQPIGASDPAGTGGPAAALARPRQTHSCTRPADPSLRYTSCCRAAGVFCAAERTSQQEIPPVA